LAAEGDSALPMSDEKNRRFVSLLTKQSIAA